MNMSSTKKIKLEVKKKIVAMPSGDDKIERNKLFISYLNSAIEANEIKEVESKVKLIANINEPGNDGWTLLHKAVKYGHLKLIEVLIKNGASVDSSLVRPRGRRFSPLHIAVQKNNLECARILLKNNASVSPKTEDVCHPIHIAVFENHAEMAKLLLDLVAEVNLRFNNLFFNIFKDKMDQSLWLDRDLPLLHYSILRNFDEMTNLLLEHGADVNLKTSSGKTALMQAVEVNNFQMVELLVERGANVNDRDNSGQPVLHFTMLNANRKISMYSKKEFEANSEKWRILKLLVNHGADVNAKFPVDEDHTSVIHYMIQYGFTQGVFWLLFCSDLNADLIDLKAVQLCKLVTDKMTLDVSCDSEYTSDLKCNFREIMSCLIRYAIGRQMIGLPIDKSVVSDQPINGWIDKQDYAEKIVKHYKNVIARQINFMKKTMIGNSKVTIWFLLTCKMDQLVNLMPNDDIKTFRSSLKIFQFEFFDYFQIMKIRLSTAEKKSKLFEQSVEAIFNSRITNLTYDCCQKVINYADEEDLEVVVRSCGKDVTKGCVRC